MFSVLYAYKGFSIKNCVTVFNHCVCPFFANSCNAFIEGKFCIMMMMTTIHPAVPAYTTAYQYNHYPQATTDAPPVGGSATQSSAKPREKAPEATAPQSGGSVADALFRNVGATLKGATLGVLNLAGEPVRHTWNFAKKGTPQTLTVVAGGAALAYGAVLAASAGTLFPIIAGGVALTAAVQLFRGGYGAIGSANPAEQATGFSRVGQSITLTALAGAALLHQKQFFHSPAWDKVIPMLTDGVKEQSAKAQAFVQTLPDTFNTWVGQLQTFWHNNLKTPAENFIKNIRNPVQ